MNRRSVLGGIAAGFASLFAFSFGSVLPFPPPAIQRRETIIIHGKTFELSGPIEFHDHMVSIEIVLRRRQMVDFVTVAGDLIARSLSERRLIGVDAAALTAKGINQLVFVSRSIPIHRLQDDFVVRLEGVLLSDVDTLLRKQRDVVVATKAD
jgi:hypothetical protein